MAAVVQYAVVVGTRLFYLLKLCRGFLSIQSHTFKLSVYLRDLIAWFIARIMNGTVGSPQLRLIL